MPPPSSLSATSGRHVVAPGALPSSHKATTDRMSEAGPSSLSTDSFVGQAPQKIGVQKIDYFLEIMGHKLKF